MTAVEKFVEAISSFELRKELSSILSGRSAPEFKEQLVLCAEKTLQHNETAAATGFLDLYFLDGTQPPNNQFLARAYLCRAQLHAPTNSKDIDALNKCTDWILNAVEFGKKKPRHHFLVYNASQLYWKLCRQFLHPDARKCLVKGLSLVVSALNKIGDVDHVWRATLMIELVKCTVETGWKEEVIHAIKQASNFCQTHAPEFLPELIHLQVEYGLTERKVLEKDLHSLFLVCHCRISDLKLLRQNSDKEIQFATKAKKLISLIARVDEAGAGHKTSTNREPLSEQEKASLLLVMAHMCLEEGETQLGQRAIDSIPASAKEDSAVAVDIEYFQCRFLVQQLGDQQELQSTQIIDVRENAVKRCYQAVQSAIRLELASLIQSGCVVLWNLCLPLLQHYCRQKAAKALRLIAETLEHMDSLLIELRCTVHIELAKCDCDQERLEMALVNIDKALALDYYNKHSQYLTIAREKLLLKIKRNDVPPKFVDKAAQLVEQISTKRDKEWTTSSYHQALSSAGERLAAGVFKLTVTEMTANSSVPIAVQLKEEVEKYELAVSQTKEFFGKTSKEDDIKLCLVWADIAKISHDNAVWDVARSSARFCLQYDDGRWEEAASVVPAVEPHRLASALGSHSKSSLKVSARSAISVAPTLPIPSPIMSRSLPSVDHGRTLQVKESHLKTVATGRSKADLMARQLLRRLVEAHFIYAEALIEMLLKKDLKLCDKPHVSSVSSWKDRISANSPEWKKYCDWVTSLSAEAVSHFHRAAQLGCVLKEQWVVHQAMGYLFNYTNHAVMDGRHADLVPLYQPLIDTYMTLQANREVELLCQMATVVASGLMIPTGTSMTINKSDSTSKVVVGVSTGKKGPDGRGVAESPQPKVLKKQGTVSNLVGKDESSAKHLDAEREKDLSAAAELCEQVNVNCGGHSVSMKVRKQLLEAWVQIKHLLQQPIAKPNYGQDNPKDPFAAQCKTLVVVEMLACKDKPPGSFTGCPSLSDVITMVESCKWIDPLIELEVWSRLAKIAVQAQNREAGLKCANKALKFSHCDMADDVGTPERRNRKTVQFELLSMACQAKALLQLLPGGNPGNQRQIALSEFVCSAKYARKAENYELIMEAARYAWNRCQPVQGQKLERELLREPLEQVLKLITELTGQDRGKEGEDGTELSKIGTQEDLDVRVELYIVVFLTYADKGEWRMGLKSVDEAIWFMPRSTHKTLVQYRILFKNKLGKSVVGDIQRLATDDQEFVTNLWHGVAKNSSNTEEQFNSYEAAIQMASTKWQQIDLLLELSNWMHLNELSREDSIRVVELAVQLLSHDEGETEHPKMLHCPEPTTVKQMGKSKPAAVVNDTIKEKSAGGVDSEDRDLSLAWRGKVTGCRRQETLLRCYVMMAQIVGRSSKQYRDHLMKSLGSCQTIWKLQDAVLVRSVASQEKERHVQEEKKGKESRLGGSKRKEKAVVPTLKPVLPDRFVDWATFQLSNEMRDALRKDCSGNAVNELTVIHVARTMEALATLSSELASNGLHLLSLPALALHHLLAHDIACNRDIVDLLHLKFINCCQSLGLSAGVAHHEQFVSNLSHKRAMQLDIVEMIELSEDQRKMVEAEERQRTLKKAKEQGLSSSTDENKRQSVNGMHMSSTPLRDRRKVEVIGIWIDQAELQLKRGCIQSARELLTFSLRAAMGVDEGCLVRRCLYHLGQLALFEGATSEAIRLLSDAQKYPTDPMTWLSTVLELAKAYRADPDKQSQATGILMYAMTVFSELAEERPYLNDECNYIQAMLQAQCARMKMEDMRKTDGRRRARKRIEAKNALELYETSVGQLLKLGYTFQAVEVMLDHSRDLRMFAESITDTSQKHSKLLEVSSILQNALLHTKSQTTQILAFIGSNQMNGSWLPVHCLVTETCHEFGELMLLVLSEEVSRQAEMRHAEDMKTREEKMLDEYRRMSPVLTATQQMWESLVKICGSVGLSTVTSCSQQTQPTCVGKAKIILEMGQFLCWIADLNATTNENSWTLRLKEQSVEMEATSNKEPSQAVSDREHSESVEAAFKENCVIAKTVWHFAHGTDLLTLALCEAFDNNDMNLAGEAALSLVECFGARDQLQSAQYLSLYQSCRASEYLYSIIKKAQDMPGESQLAALLHQHQHLGRNRNTLGSLSETNRHLLEDKYEAYRRVLVKRNHFELFSAMPSSLCFVTLQHSGDRRHLYGSVVLPSQIRTAGGDFPAVANTSVNPVQMKKLLEDFKQYSKDCERHLLRCDHLWGSQTQSQVELSSTSSQNGLQLDDDEIKSSAVDITTKEREMLEDQFIGCVMSLSAYLEPLLFQLPKPPIVEDVSAVVLLLDEWLLHLPVECIGWVSGTPTVTVTRDASLQLFYHRIRHTIEEVQEAAAVSSKKGKTGATPKPEKVKDLDKKKEKSASVSANVKVAASSILVDMSKVKYILDPRSDARGQSDNRTEENSVSLIQNTIKSSGPLTSKWSGLTGTDMIPSLRQWKESLTSSSSFVFFGTERLLSYYPPQQLAPLDVSGCKVTVLADRAHTSASFLRQSKIDANKSESSISLEGSVETAMLLSLSGVSSVIVNQYSSTLEDNSQLLCTWLRGMLEEGKTVAQALHAWRQPSSQEESPQPTTTEEAKPESSETETLEKLSSHETSTLDINSRSYNAVLYGLPHIVFKQNS